MSSYVDLVRMLQGRTTKLYKLPKAEKAAEVQRRKSPPTKTTKKSYSYVNDIVKKTPVEWVRERHKKLLERNPRPGIDVIFDSLRNLEDFEYFNKLILVGDNVKINYALPNELNGETGTVTRVKKMHDDVDYFVNLDNGRNLKIKFANLIPLDMKAYKKRKRAVDLERLSLLLNYKNPPPSAVLRAASEYLSGGTRRNKRRS